MGLNYPIDCFLTFEDQQNISGEHGVCMHWSYVDNNVHFENPAVGQYKKIKIVCAPKLLLTLNLFQLNMSLVSGQLIKMLELIPDNRTCAKQARVQYAL